MNLAEVPAHRPYQPAGPAPDFEGAARALLGLRKPFQLGFERANHIRRGGEKLFIILIATPERHEIMRVLPRPLVPFGAHPLVNFHAVIL